MILRPAELKLLKKHGFMWYRDQSTDKVDSSCIEDVVPAANGFTVIYNDKATALALSTAQVKKIEWPEADKLETVWIRVHWDTIEDQRK